MATRFGKRWQNLIRRRCPCCGARLEPLRAKTSILQCCADGCGFTISEHTVFRILSDESHILRRFLSPEDRLRLEGVLGGIAEPEEDAA